MDKPSFKSKSLRLLVFSVFLSASCISQAQTFSYGIKGGLNIAETSMDNPYESQSKTGFNLYVFVDYNVSSNFAISLMEGYTQKGFQTGIDYYSDNTRGSVIASLNYIDITVSAKVKFTNSKVIPYLTFGPSLGIVAGDETQRSGNYSEETTWAIKYILNNVSKNSFGLKTGAGLEFNINSNASIIFEANYNFDLISVYDAPDIRLGIETWIYSDNLKNNVLELMAGVKF